MFLAEYDGCEVAVKLPHHDTPKLGLREMYAASALQRRFQHPNVCRVLGLHDDPLCTLLEVCSGGDVGKLLRSAPRDNPIVPALQWRLACEVAAALHALHSGDPPVMHRDVKGSNVLLDAQQHAKLADFDLATAEPFDTYVCGTPGYMAPEVIAGKRYNRSCDVFGFGSLLYEVTHGVLPFTHEADPYTAEEVLRLTTLGTRPRLRLSCPSAMRSLIHCCWAPAPADRPPMAEVVQCLEAMAHDFLNPSPL